MENALNNEVEQIIEFVLFLDFIENLEPSLNFPLRFNVHAEFHDNQLNIGTMIINVMDTTGKIHLNIPLNFPLDEIVEYNNFASHPMLIYFQSLNKIEQNSEEPIDYNNGIKQTWVCVVDLLPLVYDTSTGGASTLQHRVGGQYPLKAVGELNRNLLSDTVARLNATVSCPEKISSFRTSPPPDNVLNVTMHGLYNPPLWDYPEQHAATTCSAMFDYVPEAIDSDIHNTVFAHGTYTDITRDVNDLRWYSLDNKPATVSATGQRLEDFDGVVINSANIFEPKDLLSKGSRFEWNQWRRFLINEKSSKIFQDFIFKHSYFPVTFTFSRNPMITSNATYSSTTQKTSLSNLDNSAMINNKVVYIAFLDLSMLLQPNCTSVRCLAIVHMIDAEMMKYNTQTLTNFDLNEPPQLKFFEDGHLEESSLIPSNNGSTDWKLPFAVVDISVTTSFHEQNLKYITTSLLKLPIAPENVKPVKCTQSASNVYQKGLKNTIETLIKYPGIECPGGVERFADKLKITGAYDLMQSSLCGEIQLYIKNHYRGPSIGETVQSFVNRIFVDLVDETKKTVESYEFPHSGHVENVKSRTVFFAREADELEQTKRAKTYLDLISTADARCNPNYWLLYASFCSRRLDFDTAVECVKEVLLVDSGNRIGLFVYAAILLTIHEGNNDGEIVLKSLVTIHRNFSEAYALLSVHYSILKMYNTSNTMLQKAENFIKEDGIEENCILSEKHMSWQLIGHNNDPLIKCAILLLELEFVKLASDCLSLVKYQCEQYHYYMAVCEYKMGNHLLSLEHLKNENIIEKHKVFNILKCLNNIALHGGESILKNDELIHAVVYTETPCEELHLVYLKIAMYYYENKQYDKAFEVCLIANTVLHTPIILILLAKCSIKIGDLETAESALDAANVLDVKNAEVWAHLTMINAKLGNANLAKVCYTRALDASIDTELKPETKKEIDTLIGKKIDTFIL